MNRCTLAATLVAHDTLGVSGQRLLDDRVLNVVLVLVLVTAILGPVLTDYFAPRRDRKPTMVGPMTQPYDIVD